MKHRPISGDEVDIKFDLPKWEWAAKLSQPTVNFYLYDTGENTGLRSNNWVVEKITTADPQRSGHHGY